MELAPAFEPLKAISERHSAGPTLAKGEFATFVSICVDSWFPLGRSRQAMTNTTPTNLLSRLAGSGTNELRDIRPPVEIPNGWLWALWFAGALIVLALLYLTWRYLKKRQIEAAIVPPIPPHVVAKQKLQDALALIGQPREFCILVSDTVRWYLEKRFDFHAPERTTEEFLHELKATDRLTPDRKSSLGEFLQRCDLVKFARYEPREPELRGLHASALRLVEETEPVAVPEGSSITGPSEPGKIAGEPPGNPVEMGAHE